MLPVGCFTHFPFLSLQMLAYTSLSKFKTYRRLTNMTLTYWRPCHSTFSRHWVFLKRVRLLHLFSSCVCGVYVCMCVWGGVWVYLYVHVFVHVCAAISWTICSSILGYWLLNICQTYLVKIWIHIMFCFVLFLRWGLIWDVALSRLELAM